MAIERVNGPGFGVGDKLTSAQINGIDINTTHALDKREGHADTLASDVTVTGPIAIEAGAGAAMPIKRDVHLRGDLSVMTRNEDGTGGGGHAAFDGKLTVGQETLLNGSVTVPTGDTVVGTGQMLVGPRAEAAQNRMEIERSVRIVGGTERRFECSPARTHAITFGIERVMMRTNGGWSDSLDDVFPQSGVPGGPPLLYGKTIGAFLYVSVPIIHGATLESIEMAYAITQQYASGMPATKLNLRAWRRAFASVAPAELAAAGPSYAVGETGGDYSTGSGIRALVYACDQNNALLTKDDEVYAMVQMETGANAQPFTYVYGFRATFSGITDLGRV